MPLDVLKYCVVIEASTPSMPLAARHTIAYDDGDVAMHRLWQHYERIRCLNTPRDWPSMAAEARARFRAGSDMLHDGLVERQVCGRSARAHIPVASIKLQYAYWQLGMGFGAHSFLVHETGRLRRGAG